MNVDAALTRRIVRCSYVDVAAILNVAGWKDAPLMCCLGLYTPLHFSNQIPGYYRNTKELFVVVFCHYNSM